MLSQREDEEELFLLDILSREDELEVLLSSSVKLRLREEEFRDSGISAEALSLVMVNPSILSPNRSFRNILRGSFVIVLV